MSENNNTQDTKVADGQGDEAPTFRYKIRQWFVENNIKTAAELAASPLKLVVYDAGVDFSKPTPIAIPNEQLIDKGQFDDVCDAAGGLLLRHEIIQLGTRNGTAMSLYSRGAGCAYSEYLASTVHDMAKELRAGLITFDVSDLESLVSSLYVQEWEALLNDPSQLEDLVLETCEDNAAQKYQMIGHYFGGRVVGKDRSTNILDAIVDAALQKGGDAAWAAPDEMNATTPRDPCCIVHLRDCHELMDGVSGGETCIDELRHCVSKVGSKREDIRVILVLSTFDDPKNHLRLNVGKLNGVSVAGMGPPKLMPRYDAAEARKIGRLNIRRLQWRLMMRCGDVFGGDLLDPDPAWARCATPKEEAAMGLREWAAVDVDSVAGQIAGLSFRNKMDHDDIWAKVRRYGLLVDWKPATSSAAAKPNTQTQPARAEAMAAWEKKLKAMAGKCDKFEEALLDCVVRPSGLDVTWNSVVLDDKTKNTILQLVSASRLRSGNKAGAGVGRLLSSLKTGGALLYGPPGTGKTHLCRAVAAASGSRMLSLDSASVESKWVGETEKYIKAAFTLAERLHPCIVFIDEVDSLFYRRSADDRDFTRRALTQFLTGLDGLAKNERAPFVLAATNRPWDLDEAFLRRLPKKVYFDLPEEKQRAEILWMFLTKEELGEDVDVDEIAKKAKGYSGSDLKSVCSTAAQEWLMDQTDKVGEKFELALSECKLKMAHFDRALKQIRPSNTGQVASEMNAFVARFNPDNTSSQDVSHSMMYI